ncbi:MAG: hypothetical protein WCL23_05605 [Candidatus Moraniibacteriota bacterium]
MPIKKIFPFLFLVIVLFVGFGFLKPTVDSIIGKLSQQTTLQNDLATAKTTRENIDKISNSLDSVLASESGKAALAFLPSNSNQDRIVDIMNVCSFQSGISVSDFSFQPNSKQPVSQVINSASDGKPVTAPVLPAPESVTMTIGVRGSYESIKSFLEKLAVSGRFHVVNAVSIKQESSKGDSNVAAAPTGALMATVKADFFNQPERSYPGANLLPVFGQGTFDTAAIDTLLKSESKIDVLPDAPTSGRGNPFAS